MKKEIYDAKQDPRFQTPYVDEECWKERILEDGGAIPYLYVHGGFQGTGVKFLLCFPQKEAYRGRFFQYLSPFPGPDEELASLDKTGEDDRIAFALKNGAYSVESNMGSRQMFGPSPEPQLVWKASAAVAEYSRVKAKEVYCGGNDGAWSRPYGYVHGGSGGGYKTMACIENTNAWDGAVPYVIGTPVSLPNSITLHAQGMRALRRVYGQIVDALDAGGSGDMYAGLTEEEAFLLKEVTAMGYNPRTWFLEAAGFIEDGSLPIQIPHVLEGDPEYFQDFWTLPGYLGADKKGNTDKDRIQFTGRVRAVHLPEKEEAAGGQNGVNDAWKKQLTEGGAAWIELEEAPRGEDLYIYRMTIDIQTGEAAGKKLTLERIEGNRLVLGPCYGIQDLSALLSSIRPGDLVRLDNSDYIAIQSYYRHQVPSDPSFHAWDQFRDAQGNPTLPQRKSVMGYNMTGTGTVQDGEIQGKVIVIQSLMDESTWPWCGDWYRGKVREAKGGEEDFRLYYMDNCMHGDVSWLENNVVTNYLGALRQALLDMSDWVERGIEPRKTTGYRYQDGQILLAETARERGGLQPVVTMLANGVTCAHVKVGEEVTFTVQVAVPEGAGDVTAVDYDYVSDASLSMQKIELTTFRHPGDVTRIVAESGLHGAVSSSRHVYDQPGTYFASARVKVNRKGDGTDYFTQVKNIARVRVVVEES